MSENPNMKSIWAVHQAGSCMACQYPAYIHEDCKCHKNCGEANCFYAPLENEFVPPPVPRFR